MNTIAETRHRNFELIQGSYDSAVELSGRIGISPSYLWQLMNKDQDGKYRRNLGEKLARKVERALDLPKGWLDWPQTVFPAENAGFTGVAPVSPQSRSEQSRASGIQNALVETAQRLVLAGLLSDLDCLALLQDWQPLIAKLKESQDAA